MDPGGYCPGVMIHAGLGAQHPLFGGLARRSGSGLCHPAESYAKARRRQPIATRSYNVATMKRLAVVVLLALLPFVAGAQQSVPTLTGRGAAEITSYLRDVAARGDIPGMVALVVNRDGVVYHEAFGVQNAAARVPMAKDTIFNIASMTKPVTSVATMMLIEEGKLRLDDEAAKYAPEVAKLPVISRVDTASETYESGRPAGP